MLIIIENFIDNSGYRINLLSFLEFDLKNIYSSVLEEDGQVLDVRTFEFLSEAGYTTNHIMLVEIRAVKIWDYNDNKFY